MFCLVTDLLDCREYPAPELAALYKWRWDGSETGLREAKASLHGAGPGRADAPLRQPRPGPAGTRRLGRRHRDDPRRHPRRRPRRRAIAEGTPCRAAGPAPGPLPCPRPPRRPRRDPRREDLLSALTREIGKYRNICDRNRHRARKSKSPGTSPTQPRGHRHPDRPGRPHHGEHPRLTSKNSHTTPRRHPPARGTGRHRHDTPGVGMPSNNNYPASPKQEPDINAQTSKAHGIGPWPGVDEVVGVAVTSEHGSSPGYSGGQNNCWNCSIIHFMEPIVLLHCGKACWNVL